jgi:hypothetical protein
LAEGLHRPFPADRNCQEFPEKIPQLPGRLKEARVVTTHKRHLRPADGDRFEMVAEAGRNLDKVRRVQRPSPRQPASLFGAPFQGPRQDAVQGTGVPPDDVLPRGIPVCQINARLGGEELFDILLRKADAGFSEAQATNSRSSSGCSANWLGCSPTGIREIVRSVSGSTTRTRLSAQSLT